MVRRQTVRYINMRGFSLIEMLFAMLLIMVSMLAFLTTMTVAMRTSGNNDVRDMSTKIVNMTAETLLALPITDPDLSTDPTSSACVNHSRTANDATQGNKGFPNAIQIVRGTQMPFTIQWCVGPLSSTTTGTSALLDSIRVDITVGYVFSNQTYTKNSVIFRNKTI